MSAMDRRQFLSFLAGTCASLSFGKMTAHANDVTKSKKSNLPKIVIDAHAHPDHFYIPECTVCDNQSALETITALGMNASSFAAVGDRGDPSKTVDFEKLLSQLQYVRNLEESGKVIIVRKISDVPRVRSFKHFVPGAILSVEGGVPLVTGLADPTDFEEVRGRVKTLYDYGVRLITLMHHRANEIGDVMTSPPVNGGLTQIGEAVVERMLDLGMVIDVAHAHIDTLNDIAEIAHSHGKPIIDSHTSPSYLDIPDKPTRLRSWAEMEMVVETGGLICTWPLKVSRPGSSSNRETILDWAKESLRLKERLGIEHIALGTDGGGGLPEVVQGWESILNIVDLADAMLEVGFEKNEVSAYMGGNFLKVLKQCIK